MPVSYQSPARAAREAAGLTVEQAARAIGRTPAYLARCELHGMPLRLAERLAKLYTCRLDVFLPRRHRDGN
ncbi:MAG TPA: helix-turn-helix transcriptional regulator [Armatimonadota bacterium]|nr:helix-turn-helix transcriptional regulator [Armatimonadota bacterium]